MATSSIPRTSGVYVIKCLKNGKFYIGSSVNLRARLNDHRNSLRKGKHRNRHLQAAWNKYGEKQFEFKILEYCERDMTLIREQHFLDILRPYERSIGFNIGIDATAARKGQSPSIETRILLSKKTKEYWSTPEGKEKKRNSALGRIVSEDTREKLRIAHTGRKHSPEARMKIKEARKHQQFTPETRARMSAAQTGKKMSDDAIAKTVAAREKNWIVISPTGEEMLIRNLQKFCTENNLNRGNMIAVAQGKRPHNKNWKCRYAEVN